MKNKIVIASILLFGLILVSTASAIPFFNDYNLDRAEAPFIPDVTYTGVQPHGNNQIAICHTPPANDITLYLNENNVEGHLNHGDYLGECEGDNQDGDDETDTIFTALEYSYGNLLEGEAMFNVTNPFEQDIPLLVDYYNYEGYITEDINYYQTFTEEPVFEWIDICSNNGNESETCIEQQQQTGTKLVENWIETTVIPAEYEGKIKLTAKYDSIAWDSSNPKSIEWIPRLVVNNPANAGLLNQLFPNLFPATTEYEQIKWDWFNASWSERTTYSINSSVIDEPLNNFTVLVILNSTNFDFSLAQANGEDLRFTNELSTELYSYEIEDFNTTSELAYIWVRIPNVSDTTDGQVILYYGNPTAVDGQDITGTWDSDYLLVYHFNSTVGGLIIDSTSGNWDATLTDSPFFNDTIIGNAMTFDGSNDGLVTSTGLAVGGNNLTVEYFVLGNSPSSSDPIYSWDSGGGGSFLFTSQYITANGTVRILSRSDGATGVFTEGSTVVGNDLFVGDARIDFLNNNQTSFVNGSVDNSEVNGAIGSSPSTEEVRIAYNIDSVFAPITLDEFRVSTSARSSSWVKANFFSKTNQLLTIQSNQSLFPATVLLLTPANNTFFNNDVIHTIRYISNNTTSTTCDILYNSSIVGSGSSLANNTVLTIPISTQSVGAYNWTAQCDMSGLNVTSFEINNIFITNETPNITLFSPNNTHFNRTNVIVNASIVDTFVSDFTCTFNETVQGRTNEPVSCNTTTINFANAGNGTFTFIARDTNSNRTNSVTNSISINPLQFFQVKNISDGTPQENFTLTFTNGTDTLIRSNVNNTTMIISLLDLPTGSPVSVTALSRSLATEVFNNTTISATSLLNTSYSLLESEVIINVFDETTGSPLTFNLTLANTTDLQNFFGVVSTFQNITEATLTGSITGLASTSSHQQRTFFYTVSEFSRVNRSVFLLDNTEGIIVRFHVVNTAGQVIPSAFVNVTRFLNGTFQTVDSGIADSTGTVTTFLDPDVIYTVVTTFGALSDTSLIRPTANDFTIILGIGEQAEIIYSLEGIGYALEPNSGTLFFNNTTGLTEINWTVVASLQDLGHFALEVQFNNTTIFLSNNTSSTGGGFIPAIINMSNASFGDTVTAIGTFQRAGFEIFIVNRTYTLRNSSFSGTSIQGIFDQLETGGTGLSMGGKMLIALLISAIIGGAIGGFIGAGRGWIMIGSLGIFASVGWFDLWVLTLIGIALISGYALRRA